MSVPVKIARGDGAQERREGHTWRSVGLLALVAIMGRGTCAASAAPGVSPYLPLNLSPQIERMVERVLILGGQPTLTRPVPITKIMKALPAACRRDAALCAQVNRYLDRYFGIVGITHASAAAGAAGKIATSEPPRPFHVASKF